MAGTPSAQRRSDQPGPDTEGIEDSTSLVQAGAQEVRLITFARTTAHAKLANAPAFEVCLPLDTMTHSEYHAAARKYSWCYGLLFIAISVTGLSVGLSLADRVAHVVTWPREFVFLAFLPVLIFPFLLARLGLSLLNRWIGIKCPGRGSSLSLGPHVRSLIRQGGACPQCGMPVVGPSQPTESKAGGLGNQP